MLRGFDIKNNLNKGTAVFDTHLHDQFEINFILSDGIEVLIEDKLFLSQKGDIFIFPPYTFHRIDSGNKPFSRYLMFFDEASTLAACSALQPAIAALKNSNFLASVPDDAGIKELLKLFEVAHKEKTAVHPLSDYKTVTAIGNVLSFIIPLLKRDDSPRHSPETEHEILRVLNHINHHLGEDLSVEAIAKHFGMSSTTLWHMMKNSIRLSPKEYIVKMRIAKATELLANGASVTETAEKAGFNSYAHFIRTFTKHIGISPYRYGKTST